MINKIVIEGFKCFDCAEINLGNMTLLAGQNSKGKTTVIQSLFAMLQDGNNPFRGEYMNIGKSSELENAIVGSREIKFSIQYEQDGCNKVASKVVSKNQVTISGENCIAEGKKVIYCSADRIGVKDTYEKYIGDDIIIGNNCEYAFHYLVEHEEEIVEDYDFVYDLDSKLTFGGQVDFWLDKIIGYRIKAVEIEKTEFIQVLYYNNHMNAGVSPKNVGTGVTYIAEIIIAALSCKVGDLLIIENPEIHLHPSGQAELVRMLTFLAQCGVQIILETHSDHIYNGIRKCIRLDDIDSENVSIYFFRQKENGCSEPVEIPISDEGKVLKQADGLFDQIKKDLDVILGW